MKASSRTGRRATAALSKEGTATRDSSGATARRAIVISAGDFLPEELLLAGAELTWRAGPHGLKKGSSICHGTAGNGYAFLKAFERTGDEQWLERARRFAVHALEQVERRGTGHYSLFTGDLGVAVYVADCLDGSTRFPVLETWE